MTDSREQRARQEAHGEATELAARKEKQAKQYTAAAARPTFINTGATWQQQGWHMFHARPVHEAVAAWLFLNNTR